MSNRSLLHTSSVPRPCSSFSPTTSNLLLLLLLALQAALSPDKYSLRAHYSQLARQEKERYKKECEAEKAQSVYEEPLELAFLRHGTVVHSAQQAPNSWICVGFRSLSISLSFSLSLFLARSLAINLVLGEVVHDCKWHDHDAQRSNCSMEISSHVVVCKSNENDHFTINNPVIQVGDAPLLTNGAVHALEVHNNHNSHNNHNNHNNHNTQHTNHTPHTTHHIPHNNRKSGVYLA
eukprot:TRINITY_DN5522_c0_g1_i1.p1 TRINITY_DN5522_c0_g1~~TRINITY_DN5522_c0_g1_i1.p1  ORF type:complete len:235 (-),score=39.27 TRINITY_DN5522_c0_g1_i1:105-809(-)